MKQSLYTTTRRKALIFGMWHNLKDFYQVYSNYAPRTINGPTAGVTLVYKVKTIKQVSCVKPQGLEYWYLVCSII